MTRYVIIAFATAALAAGGAHAAAASPSSAAPDPAPALPGAPAAPTPEHSTKTTAELLAAETSAWQAAKPVFDGACAACHTKAGKKATKKKLNHFDMDSYPLGGHHAGTIGFTIRDVLGISGKKPTMPFSKPGSVQGDDLAKIKAWTDAWEAADKAGAHPAAPHKHTD
jgi:mono/diheme cytochrome c family protein